MRRSIVASLAALVCAAALAACSSSSSSNSSVRAASGSVTLEQAADWFGRAAELAHPCQLGAQTVDAALDTAANSPVTGDSDMPTVLAAGQAVTTCEIEPDSSIEQREWAALAEILPTETAKLREWIDATIKVDQNALLVAAGNFDSNRFVTTLFDSQRTADAIADEFERMIDDRAASLGVDPPQGEVLYHWKAPGH